MHLRYRVTNYGQCTSQFLGKGSQVPFTFSTEDLLKGYWSSRSQCTKTDLLMTEPLGAVRECLPSDWMAKHFQGRLLSVP
jgi:hypothetical protein